MKRRSKARKKAKARSSKVKARKAVAKAKSSKKSRFLKSRPKRSVKRSHTKPRKSKSRAPRAKIPLGQSMVSEPLEQVIVTCANCSRQFTVVKLPGLSLEGMICQRCELGEIEFPE